MAKITIVIVVEFSIVPERNINKSLHFDNNKMEYTRDKKFFVKNIGFIANVNALRLQLNS